MEDLSGKTFGTIQVLRFSHKQNGHIFWHCVCLECGHIFVREGYCLRITHMKGCKKCGYHRASYTRLYKIWQGIKTRCFNSKSNTYIYYGAKGITICDKWLDFHIFQRWALNNGYDETLTIDRINPHDNYSPENCRWVDTNVQNNNKRNTRKYIIKGECRSLMEWCKQYNQIFDTVSARLKRGMSLEDALMKQPELRYSHRRSS